MVSLARLILRRAALAAFLVLTASQLCLAQNEEEMSLVSKDASIQAVVGEEDGEGLWVVTSDGTNYSVWTPEDISLEVLSAFQQTFKNKEVTLVGDVYKDKFGNLNLFVKSLPR
uniref:Uncharacterized protein n=1 Tax=Fundidesulfovibrio putealis TaxID=270496 RepID=A0A7C4AGR4_9BACT